MNNISYILDASAFIGGFVPEGKLNFTVSEVTNEVRDLKSKLILDNAIEEGNLTIKNPQEEFINKLEEIISSSGDSLRLSIPDKQLLALALEIQSTYKNIIVLTDDYSIQNVLKILKLPFKSIITEGIKGVYNWKITCSGCKKEYPDDYSYYECEICGSKLFKRRIKTY